ncbi:hypothetical protein GGR52DRAFT_561364 [Hypoxylon sp. FL1284]|nr:hypothetical protein GGR52DRAFT_561364 [Hypoxylon sp. FL1284]
MSGRNTRARSRGSSATPSSNRRGPYREPASSDLPGLYPVHDGSYGLNTLINVDSPGRRRSTRSRQSYVTEDEEDTRFARGIDTNNRHRNGMAMSSASVSQSVQDADRDDGAMQYGQTAQDDNTRTGVFGAGQQDRAQQARAAAGGSGGRPVRDSDVEQEGLSYLPTLTQPFGSTPYRTRPRPPYTTVQARSSDPHSMTTGSGVSTSAAGFRPDSARSFAGESGLFGEASLHTPAVATRTTRTTSNAEVPGGNASTTSRAPPASKKSAIPTSDNPGGNPNVKSSLFARPGSSGTTTNVSGGNNRVRNLRRPPDITDAEWTRVQGVIESMRVAQSTANSSAPALSGLTEREVEAIRYLVTRGQIDERAIERRLFQALGEIDAPLWDFNRNLSDEEINRRVNNLISDMLPSSPARTQERKPYEDTHQILGASDAQTIGMLARNQADADSIINILRRYPQSRILFNRDVAQNADMAYMNNVIRGMRDSLPRVTTTIEDTHVVLTENDPQGIKAMVGSQAEADSIVSLLRSHPSTCIAFPKSGQDQLSNEEVQKRINNVIHDMVLSPGAAPNAQTPVNLPPNLTAAEIQALRGLVPDMTNDQAYGQAMTNALDEAAGRIPRPSSDVPRPSSNVPGPSSNVPGPPSNVPRPSSSASRPPSSASRSSNNAQLTNEQVQRRINDVIHDMVLPQGESQNAQAPIKLPPNLTADEIRQMRVFIPDLVIDRAYGQRLAAALDEAARNLPRPSSSQRNDPQIRRNDAHAQTSFEKAQQNELRIMQTVNNVIHDMMLSQDANKNPYPPVNLPSDLTRSDIQEMKSLIPDMTDDPVYRLRITAALNEAAQKAPADQPTSVNYATLPRLVPTLDPKIVDPKIVDPKIVDPKAADPKAADPKTAAQLPAFDDYGEEDLSFEGEFRDRTPRRRTAGASTWWVRAAVVGAILALVLGIVPILGGQRRSDMDDIFPEDNVSWLSWDGVVGGLGRLVPPLPRFGESKTRGIGSKLVAEVQKADGALGELMEDIRKRLPKEIFVDRAKSGKLRISDDFWHALKDLIKNDPIFLTLKRVKDVPQISEDHWHAIKARIEQEASSLFPSSSGNAGDGTSGSVSWEKWVTQNKNKLKDLFKSETGFSMSREDFLKLFREEIQSYQKDIRKEFAARDAQIKDLVSTVARLGETAKGAGGMTDKQVRAICDQVVAKAIQRTKLSAVADGRIKGSAKEVFDNSVNFFSVGAGAVIDPRYSSRAWKIPRNFYPYKSQEWYEQLPYVPQSQQSAIMPWFQEGECFCTGPTARGLREETNAIAVILSRYIVPQHLVVEHLAPGSTLDPGARPKDIEVWMNIEELTLREEVALFSQGQFGTAAAAQEKQLHEGFIKVAHFTYDDLAYGDGTQIFKLSDELASMRASSKHFVVRAVSNHGADHTCFYRLRLYGDIADVRPWEDN